MSIGNEQRRTEIKMPCRPKAEVDSERMWSSTMTFQVEWQTLRRPLMHVCVAQVVVVLSTRRSCLLSRFAEHEKVV